MKRKKPNRIRKALAIFCFVGVAVYICTAFFGNIADNTKIALLIVSVVFAVLGVLVWPKQKRQQSGNAAVTPADIDAARAALARVNSALDQLEQQDEDTTVNVFHGTPPPSPTDTGESIAVLDDEIQDPLRTAFKEQGLDPDLIRVDLHGDSGFTVRYQTIYLGRYYRCVTPDRWAIKKPGASRATRVFDNEIEARQMVAARPEYQIEYRPGKNIHSLQYMTSLQDYTDVDDPTPEQCLLVIEKWAQYARLINDGWADLLQP